MYSADTAEHIRTKLSKECTRKSENGWKKADKPRNEPLSIIFNTRSEWLRWKLDKREHFIKHITPNTRQSLIGPTLTPLRLCHKCEWTAVKRIKTNEIGGTYAFSRQCRLISEYHLTTDLFLVNFQGITVGHLELFRSSALYIRIFKANHWSGINIQYPACLQVVRGYRRKGTERWTSACPGDHRKHPSTF